LFSWKPTPRVTVPGADDPAGADDPGAAPGAGGVVVSVISMLLYTSLLLRFSKSHSGNRRRLARVTSDFSKRVARSDFDFWNLLSVFTLDLNVFH
jgi:hypothetical protein